MNQAIEISEERAEELKALLGFLTSPDPSNIELFKLYPLTKEEEDFIFEEVLNLFENTPAEIIEIPTEEGLYINNSFLVKGYYILLSIYPSIGACITLTNRIEILLDIEVRVLKPSDLDRLYYHFNRFKNYLKKLIFPDEENKDS